MFNYSFIGNYDPLLENIRHEERFRKLIRGAQALHDELPAGAAR